MIAKLCRSSGINMMQGGIRAGSFDVGSSIQNSRSPVGSRGCLREPLPRRRKGTLRSRRSLRRRGPAGVGCCGQDPRRPVALRRCCPSLRPWGGGGTSSAAFRLRGRRGPGWSKRAPPDDDLMEQQSFIRHRCRVTATASSSSSP